MSTAFVFLNCDIGTEPTIIDKMNKIAGISETARVSGVYDIVAKVSEESKESVARLVKQIRGIASVRSSLTMIIAEDHARLASENKQARSIENSDNNNKTT